MYVYILTLIIFYNVRNTPKKEKKVVDSHSVIQFIFLVYLAQA